MSLWGWMFNKRKKPLTVTSYSQYKLNIHPSSPDDRDYTVMALSRSLLPTSLSYEEFAEVKNQGLVGACGSFALTTGMEMMAKLKGERFPAPLSERFHYWNVRQDDYVGNYPNDWGQDGRNAFKCAAQIGVAPEKLCEYDEFLYNEEPGQFAFGFAKFWKIKRYEGVYSTAALKTALVEKKVVWLGIPVQQKFRDYKSGVLKWEKDKPSLGGHAMCVVGFDDSKQAFRLVNSWGAHWGEQGFLWLSYDYLLYASWFDCWSGAT